MAVRLIKKAWWVDFSFNRTRYRKRSPENSRAGSLAYEAMLRQKLARGENLEEERAPEKPPFREFVKKWFEEYVVTNNKYSEQRTKEYILSASLVPFFGPTPVDQITVHHIEQYKAALAKSGITGKTINNRLTILSTCLKTAYEWLEIETPPPKIKRLKCINTRADYLSEAECARLLGCTEGIVRELILTAIRTGMRQGELKGLQWGSIDWNTRILVVRHSRCDYRKILDTPKSNKERYIPLDPDVYEVLEMRKRNAGYVFVDTDGQPFDEKRLERRLTQACKAAGLRRVTWHVLRHTFASQLAMRGVPLNVVQTLLGHSSITTTMRYAHVAPSSLRTAIDMLRPVQVLGQPGVNQWAERQWKEAA